MVMPGLRVPRKRVEVADVMQGMLEENSIGSWNNGKAAESKEQEHQGFDSDMLNSTHDRPLSPPLRADDDFDRDSEDAMNDSVDEFPNGGQTIDFNWDTSLPNGNHLESVQEEVADSERSEAQFAGMGVEDDVFVEDFLDVIMKDKSPAAEGDVLRMPHLETDLHLASSSRFPELFDHKPINENGVVVFSSENPDLPSLALQMDEDDVTVMGPSQESSHSQSRLTTHNFILSPTSHEVVQSGLLSDSWQQFDHAANLFSLGVNPDEIPPQPEGNELYEDPFGSSLQLAIPDTDAKEQKSVNAVFGDSSRTVDQTLPLLSFPVIDRDRPSQNSGSVLASDVQLIGSIHAADSARIARTPSAGVLVAKLVTPNKDLIALSSDSDSDDDMTFFSHEGQSTKRRAEDLLEGYNRKRQHLQAGSSHYAEWNTYAQHLHRSKISTSGRGFEWQKGQFTLGDWRTNPQPWNIPGAVHRASRDGSIQLDNGMDGRVFMPYAKSIVEANARVNGMQLSAAYDLNVANNLQVARTVPTTAQSIMKDTLAGNNNDEEDPPEGHLSVALLKHQVTH